MARTADPKRRENILKAAREVFNERGYTEARMSEIAEKAGVAAGTLYLYFNSKEALVTALGEDYVARLAERIQGTLGNPDAREAITNSVHVTFECAKAERDILHLLDLRMALGNRREVLPADKRLQEMLADAIAQRIERGEFHAYDPMNLAAVIGGLMEWVSRACLVWGTGEIEHYEETVVSVLHHALLQPENEEIKQS